MVALFREILLFGNEGFQRLCNPLLDERRLTVETLECDVWHFIRHGLAQYCISRVLVVVISGAELHIDVGMRFLEQWVDSLKSDIEKG